MFANHYLYARLSNSSHIGREVKALLSANFGDNRNYPDILRMHSLLDYPLNPCDFWLWGFIKYRVCRGVIRTLPGLKASIIRHVAEIPHELLHATIENAIMLFEHVIDANGAHIEHIL
ncbi:uncharacterized protein TNCV_4215951 [Trichonephila clavipes]|nr:uncharacterized protein TNCV_4215951 [Trichonephila clavipes]